MLNVCIYNFNPFEQYICERFEKRPSNTVHSDDYHWICYQSNASVTVCNVHGMFILFNQVNSKYSYESRTKLIQKQKHKKREGNNP